jgi:acetone carboxylase gamma subunit
MSERASRDVLRDLETSRMSWGEVREILRQEKTPDRFAEATPFGDDVLLRLGEYLYVVREADGTHTVRCGECSHAFGDPRVNWKLSARVRIRRTLEEFMEIYHYEEVCPEPGIAEVREYLCPGCFTLLSVECVPIGYPPVFEFLPDLASVYEDILGQSAPADEDGKWVFEDRTLQAVQKWGTA